MKHKFIKLVTSFGFVQTRVTQFRSLRTAWGATA